MSSEPPFVSAIALDGNDQLGQFVSGMLDALIGIGVALANAGLLDRWEIAETMRIVIEQQMRRDAGPRPAAQFAPEALRKFFTAPVMEGGRGRAGLVPLDGGRHDDPPSRQGDSPAATCRPAARSGALRAANSLRW